MAYGSGGFRRGGSSGGGGFRRSFGPREMHKITCSECGKEAEVPFKPREGTPVYCKECFMAKKGITPRESKPKAEEESEEEAEEEAEESEKE
jgi:CxxC-x17-CxxC domain-containing protein